MRTAEVVLRLAIKRTVLAVLAVFTLLVMLWVWVLAVQVLALLVLVKLLLYRKQILRSRQERFAFLGTHVKASIISSNTRL